MKIIKIQVFIANLNPLDPYREKGVDIRVCLVGAKNELI